MNSTSQLIFGHHAVSAALKNPLRRIQTIFVKKQSEYDSYVHLAQSRNISVEYLSVQNFKQRFPNYNHQGIAAQCEALVEYTESELEKLSTNQEEPILLLLLDGVTDPHNFGACLRSADATGVHAVIVPKDNSAPMTPVVHKVACGAAESVPIFRVTNLARSMKQLKEAGIWLYGAAGEAQESLYRIPAQNSIGLVLGAEGHGLRRLTKEYCDGLFSIPMLGSVSSLNVSVATGVCLYEVIRQRTSL